MKTLFASMVIALATLGSQAAARPEVVTQIPVDDRFDIGAMIMWSSDGGRDQMGYYGGMLITNYNGEWVLCGAGYFGSTLRNITRQRMRDYFLKANGETVIRDMRFFNNVSRNEFEAGAMANCASTGLPDSQQYEWNFEAHTTRYYD